MATSSSCAPTDRLLQTLRVHVPGVTDPVLQLELFNVMDEFFRRTSAWTYTTDVTLVDDKFEYVLGTPADTVVVRVMGVTHNNLPVPPAVSGVGAIQSSVGTIDPSQIFPDGDAAFDPMASDLVGNVFSYAIYRPGYIQITGEADAEAQQFPLKVVSALSLSRGCLECDCGDWSVDDWMWDMYFQDWLDGTLGKLYAMPAKPWAAPQQAVYHTKRFRNAMALRKQEAPRGFIWNQPLWHFPRGGWI